MRILFGENVVLNVLLKREPWRAEARELWDAAAVDTIEGYLAPTTITTIYYLARKLPGGAEPARHAVQACLDTLEICPMDRRTLEAALAKSGGDYENNVQIVCAEVAQLDGIVTRNVPDFTAASCTVYTPAELLAAIQPPAT
ncbi:MAG TPA: PIN domain-containing protein [Ktedonobacterales bacterium]|nr:PIN domain-containing protein [Ktedonobacterales bacterium]